MTMTRVLLKLALVATATVAAHADPILCDLQTWQYYIDNYAATGCFVGDKLFSNFNISNSNVSASNITAQPQQDSQGEGLFFSSVVWFAFPGQTKTSTLTYTVAAPGPFISGAYEHMVANIASGTGTITVDEDLRQGITDIPGSPMSLAFSAGPPFTKTLDFVAAGGTLQTSLNIETDILVHSNNPGQATLSQITEQFTQVSAPEPVQSFLIGSGFLLLGLVSRKRRK